MELYLITGFLGAGKTTFLKNFIKLFSNKRIFLIINEFGKVGVDGTLLQEMNATLAEINNGSIFCACRLDKFEEVLQNAVLQKPEVILVEASGLSNPTNVRKVLASSNYSMIKYMGSVCLVDAVSFEKVVQTASVCPKQIAVSSLALINKTDCVTAEKIESVKNAVRQINPAIAIEQTSFGEFLKEWLQDIVPQVVVEEDAHYADITLQKMCVTINELTTKQQLLHVLNLIAPDTYRIKGFVKTTEGFFAVSCVGLMVEISEYNESKATDIGKLVALAGKGMPLRKTIKNAKQLYVGCITEVEQ